MLELPDTEGLELIVAHKAIKGKKGDYMRNLSSPPRDKMMRKADKQK